MQRFALTCLAMACLADMARAQDMALSQVLVDGAGWQLVAGGFRFADGPAVDATGRLYFTDIPDNKIYRLDDAGKPRVFVEDSGGTNGLMFGPGGRLFGCQNDRERIVAFDSEGHATAIAEGVHSNDLVVSGEGGVYFTDPDNHQVWYVSPKGDKRVVDEGIERPNGIVLWPDQGTLVVADTRGPYLWVFRVEADGSLSHKQPYYTMQIDHLHTASGADGMTIDSAGRLYVATYAGLQMFDPSGRLSGIILRPQDGRISNVVFGGPKLDVLYVTCGDKVFRRQTKVTGMSYVKATAGK